MPTSTTQETEAVIRRYTQSITQGTDAILGNYAEDAIFFNQNGIQRGLAEIRAAWDMVVKGAPEGLMEDIMPTQLVVDGEHGYMVSKAKSFLFIINDTFVVRNGKIAIHTIFIPEEFGGA